MIVDVVLCSAHARARTHTHTHTRTLIPAFTYTSGSAGGQAHSNLYVRNIDDQVDDAGEAECKRIRGREGVGAGKGVGEGEGDGGRVVV